MKYSKGELGRIFCVRLEDGDRLDKSIEKLAEEENIKRAAVIFLGGVDKGSRLIVGPKEGHSIKVESMELMLDNIYEAAGVGTIFPDENGKPVLHMHSACGRKEHTRTGCVRAGVDIWLVGEAVIFEIRNNRAIRKKEKETGLVLLDII